MSLVGASSDRLVETLRHDNMLWRKHAQRLLVERGETDVVPALIELVENESVDATGLNVGAIHALWTLHGLGQLDGRNERALAAATGALDHPSSGVRRNAVQVVPKDAALVPAIVSRLRDDHAQVRLETLVALADVPASVEAGRAIFAMLGQLPNAEDRWIREASMLAAAVHGEGFLAAAEVGGVAVDQPDADLAPILARLSDPSTADASEILADVTRIVRSHATAAADPPVAIPAADESDVADVVFEIGVTTDMMRFDTEELRVQAGRTVRVVFTNTDHMEHNLLFIMPESLERVGRLADQMMTSPEGRQQHYVPNTPDVLAYTPVLEPAERYELTFTAPDEPGAYPFICTIPGHWRIMQGILFVEPPDVSL